MVVAALFYPQFSLNHDSSWYLVATRMWLDGERLYVGIIEINPPLAFYLTAPALYFAGSVGLAPTTGFYLYTVVLSGASSLWLMRIVLRANLSTGAQMALLIGGIAGVFVMPVREFGQREHIMLILALPYLYYLILGDRGAPIKLAERIALGAVAAIGLALKPHFLLIPALIVLVAPLRDLFSRMIDPANLTLGTMLVAYAVFIAAVHPEYLSQIVPVATQVYSSYGGGWVQVLLRREMFALLCFVALCCCRGKLADGISLRLQGAIAGALMAYLLQFKGWNYHVLPFSFLLMLGSVWLFWARGAFVRRDMLVGALAIVVLVLTLGRQVELGPYRAPTTAAFAPFIERPDMPVLVLSSNVFASFPFINEVQARWSSRFPAQWYIPGAMVGLAQADCPREPQQCARFDDILFRARTAIIEDIARNRPELLFVDVRREKSYFEGLTFDYLAFLQRDPAFDPLLASYRKVGHAAGYEVWRRQGD
ncbi:hypothetical protein HUV48_04190 [Altererythrobacter sp. HHU K3-1]|uniref:Glycosyltransferase RgtA/B/C/D-like domain-containing protein n=2 Tax=Qipengyuania atrilutea TaxID=2744473 RepID=A0A850H0H7_9SPHN|nr:hypothetical protein [Actirhodobacter atriluteus]